MTTERDRYKKALENIVALAGKYLTVQEYAWEEAFDFAKEALEPCTTDEARTVVGRIDINGDGSLTISSPGQIRVEGNVEFGRADPVAKAFAALA